MSTPLHDRFVEALADMSVGDSHVYLTYAEQEDLEENETYADVAREKLPLIERALWWAQATAGVALLFLVASTLLTLLAHNGTALTTTPFAHSLSIVLWPVLFSLAAMFNLWRALRLTQKQLLCELVIDMATE